MIAAMTADNSPLVLAREPRWRRLWPWGMLAAGGLTLITGPFLPIFAALGVSALVIWWLQGRRYVTSVAIDGDEILIVNSYAFHRVPLAGAKVEIGDRMVVPMTDSEGEVRPYMRESYGSKALYVSPAGAGVDDKIAVSVALGLSPQEFQRVARELQAAVAAAS